MGNENILKVTDDGKYRVRLVSDEDCQSPRLLDTEAHAVTVKHRHYADVNGSRGPLADGWDRLSEYSTDHQTAIFQRWAKIFHGATVLEDAPERGPVAVWYTMPDTNATDPAAYLECEARVYRQWADGETYGYVIEKLINWNMISDDGKHTRTSAEWEREDDADADGWGLIGFEHARETAIDALNNWTRKGN